MTVINPWNPFRELEELLARYHQYTGQSPGQSIVRDDATESDWSPSADISEDEYGIAIRAELPGVRKQDIELCITDHVLTLSGEKHAVLKPGTGSDRSRTECCYGQFVRRFTLPTTADAKMVTAHLADGILTITIPRTPGTAVVTFPVNIQ